MDMKKITVLAVAGAFGIGTVGATAFGDDGEPIDGVSPVEVAGDERDDDAKHGPPRSVDCRDDDSDETDERSEETAQPVPAPTPAPAPAPAPAPVYDDDDSGDAYEGESDDDDGGDDD